MMEAIDHRLLQVEKAGSFEEDIRCQTFAFYDSLTSTKLIRRLQRLLSHN